MQNLSLTVAKLKNVAFAPFLRWFSFACRACGRVGGRRGPAFAVPSAGPAPASACPVLGPPGSARGASFGMRAGPPAAAALAGRRRRGALLAPPASRVPCRRRGPPSAPFRRACLAVVLAGPAPPVLVWWLFWRPAGPPPRGPGWVVPLAFSRRGFRRTVRGWGPRPPPRAGVPPLRGRPGASCPRFPARGGAEAIVRR